LYVKLVVCAFSALSGAQPMNTPGDGDEDLELLTQGLPLSAPVAADMGQSRTSHPYLPRSVVPATQWGSRAAAEEPRAAGETAPSDQPGPAVRDERPTIRDERPTIRDERPTVRDERPSSGHATRDGHAAAVGRGGHERAPQPPWHSDYLFSGGPPGEPPEDPNRVILRKQLDALRMRAANAASWQEASQHYTRLINSDGVVPVTARFSRDDIEFLGRAREEVLGLAELALRLLELHAPLDAGGISTDPSSPIMRCRSCMWRWPCPTFSLLSETVSQLPHPGPPLTR
jgi:hypothetical protein